MKVGLLGITGGVGGIFAKLALDKGHEIIALARTPSKVTLKHAQLKIIPGNSTSAADVAKVAQGVDVVVSCVGQPPRASTHIMETTAANILSASPKKVILISSLGLCGSSPFIRYVLSLIAGSANIRDAEAADRLGCNSSCPWVVVRPAGLGDGAGSGKYATGDRRILQADCARGCRALFARRAHRAKVGAIGGSTRRSR